MSAAADGPPIKRVRGDTADFVFSIRENGAAMDLTSTSWEMGVAATPDVDSPDTPLWTLAGIIDTPAAGQVSFSPSSGDVAIEGVHYYQIRMTDAGGKLCTVAQGQIDFRPGILP